MSPSLRVLSVAHCTCHYQIIAPGSSVCSGWMQKWQVCCGSKTHLTLRLRIQPRGDAPNFLSQLKNTSASCFPFHANTNAWKSHKPWHIVTRAHWWLRLHRQHRAQKEVRDFLLLWPVNEVSSTSPQCSPITRAFQRRAASCTLQVGAVLYANNNNPPDDALSDPILCVPGQLSSVMLKFESDRKQQYLQKET